MSGGQFPETPKSLVAMATSEDDAIRNEGFTYLNNLYLYPLRVYCVMRGTTPIDAEDIVQQFLFDLWEKGKLQNYDPRKGRFGIYLRKAIDYRLKDDYRFKNAKKRTPERLDDDVDVDSIPGKEDLPSRRYDVEVALSVFRNAVMESKMGKLEPIERNLFWQSFSDTSYYKELVEYLGKEYDAVRRRSKSLAGRFNLSLQKVVARTLGEEASPESVQETIDDFCRLLGRSEDLIETLLVGYQLELTAVDEVSDLPQRPRLVVLAKIANALYLRIYDFGENLLFDQPESALEEGEDLAALKTIVDSPTFPAVTLSTSERHGVVLQALSVSRQNHEYFR